MNRLELICITSAQLLGTRARHGYDPTSPELIGEAVGQAHAVVAEVEKRLLAETGLDVELPVTTGSSPAATDPNAPAPTPRAR